MRGCIVKRGPASFSVVVYLGRDPQTGKDRRKWFSHRTRREAEAHLSTLLTQLHGGGTLPTTKLRLGEYLAQWLRDHVAATVSPVTFASYRETVRLHLAPALGHVPLHRLSPHAIQQYCTQKLGEGLSSTTVRYHVMTLHAALTRALKWGLLIRNPCDNVEPPRKQRHEMRVWDEEQVRLFLAEAKRSSLHYRLYLAALTTGMRQGELLGLRWQDLDFTLGVASVRQTFYRLGGNKKDGRPTQALFKEPKTAKARRTVALPSTLVEELRHLREAQAEPRRLFGLGYAADLDLVFCQPNGKPLHAHNVAQRDFRRIIKRASLPRVRFHDLRHCHATLLLQQGVHPKVVQERLGHTTIGMTLDTYSHVMPGMQEQAARQLEERLLGQGSTDGPVARPHPSA